MPCTLEHQFNFPESHYCFLFLLLLSDATSFWCFHGPPVHSRLIGLNGISNLTNTLTPSVVVLQCHHMTLAWLTLLKGNSGASCSICRSYLSLEPSFLSQIKICLSIISAIGHSSAFCKYTCVNCILLAHDSFGYSPTDELWMFCNVSRVRIFYECEMVINSLNCHSWDNTFIAKPSLDKNYKIVLRKIICF